MKKATYSLCDEISQSLSQDFKNWENEIILVNDGSKDNTREEILEAKSKYSNIIAIDLQKNY